MSMCYPIADMLTRVLNGLHRHHTSVSMQNSKVKVAIAEVLKEEGYIEDFKVLSQKPRYVLQIDLKYLGGRRDRRSVISGIVRVSNPGRRIYVDKNSIPWVLSGMGSAIMTTSRGIMTGQQARRLGEGGEVICKVW